MSEGCCELDYNEESIKEEKIKARIIDGIVIILTLIALGYLVWIA